MDKEIDPDLDSYISFKVSPKIIAIADQIIQDFATGKRSFNFEKHFKECDESPINIMPAIMSYERFMAHNYEAHYFINPSAPFMSFEKFCWTEDPDRYEHCGGRIP